MFVALIHNVVPAAPPRPLRSDRYYTSGLVKQTGATRLCCTGCIANSSRFAKSVSGDEWDLNERTATRRAAALSGAARVKLPLVAYSPQRPTDLPAVGESVGRGQ